MTTAKEGWGWPANSTRVHYFREGRSLCGKWAFFGELDKSIDLPASDYCGPCAKKLGMEIEKRESQEGSKSK